MQLTPPLFFTYARKSYNSPSLQEKAKKLKNLHFMNNNNKEEEVEEEHKQEVLEKEKDRELERERKRERIEEREKIGRAHV